MKAIRRKRRHQRFYVVQQFAYVHGAHRTQSTTFRVDYNLSVSLQFALYLSGNFSHTHQGLHNGGIYMEILGLAKSYLESITFSSFFTLQISSHADLCVTALSATALLKAYTSMTNTALKAGVEIHSVTHNMKF